MTRAEMAVKNFMDGYNCTQSITLAFADILPIDTGSLLRISSPFGGGMGRLREVCGSVSGMFIVIGLLYGYDTPETGEAKKVLYERVQSLASSFEHEHGSIVCRELLAINKKHDSPVPEQRTQEYYRKRPCIAIISSAAQILDDYLVNNPIHR